MPTPLLAVAVVVRLALPPTTAAVSPLTRPTMVSLKAGSKIYYDAENMRVTNSAKANEYLRREPRNGWTL